jgi:TrmH family RNA methyltransferase
MPYLTAKTVNMISKNQLKQLRALGQKKHRKQSGQFLVQGEKNVAELLNSALVIEHVFASEEFVQQHGSLLTDVAVTVGDEEQLSRASTLISNNAAIAIVKQPKTPNLNRNGISIVLDGVSDPGNLGTIIRVADWYGIDQVICSLDCADPYNPKTISSTMGSFARVSCIQLDIEDYLQTDTRPKYGAFLEGQSIHTSELPAQMVLVMGSESHGIRTNIATFITDKITIPAFGEAESLNVAMATGILLDNYARVNN